MKVTIKQLQRLVAEAAAGGIVAQAHPLNPVGDSVSDELLTSFLEDMRNDLIDVYREDPSVGERLGSQESYSAQVDAVVGAVESYIRNRLLDLWAGEFIGEVSFRESDYHE